MKNRDRIMVLSLGCSKNLVDSENLIGLLNVNHVETTQNLKKADILIINTCGFINPAKEESLQVILEASELKKQKKIRKIIVTGCLTQRYGEELSAQLPFIDCFFGVDSNDDIIKALVPDLKYILLGERQLLTPKHYAYLKISEGCDHLCSFCSIPFIRGRYVSRPMTEIIEEAQKLAVKGVKELIIIAQDTTFYGMDLTGSRQISGLLEHLSAVEGIEWLRLMYTFPTAFPEDLINVIAWKNNICKYIDLPLQHISNKILKAMHRGIDERHIRELIDKLRGKIPRLALRTTFIVGFPGETERDFQKLYDFAAEMAFERIGVFTYSHEDNTPAFSLSDLIPEKIAEERRNAIMELQSEKSLKRNKSLIGKTIRVLVDEWKGDSLYGRTEWDAPDVDNGVYIKPSDKNKIGKFLDVRVEGAEEYDLMASIT